MRPERIQDLLVKANIISLLLVPAVFTVRGLGSTGTPANILGLASGAAAMWSPRATTRPTFHRLMAGVFLGSVVISSSWAGHRYLPAIEESAILRYLVISSTWVMAYIGLVNACCTRERALFYCRFFAHVASAAALVACAQYVTRFALVDIFSHVPGIEQRQALDPFVARDGLVRVAGTAIHPIEFGFMLCLALPVLLFERSDLPWTSPRRSAHLGQAGAIVIAVGLTISRSAVIELAIVIASSTLIARGRTRRQVLALVGAIIVGASLIQPDHINAVIHIFSKAGSDSSITHRTAQYQRLASFVKGHVLLGRGPGTFLPQNYVILDNEYLGLLADSGILGIAALMAWSVYGLWCSKLGSASSGAPAIQRALGGSLLAGLTGIAFYDAFAFPIGGGSLFLTLSLVVGCYVGGLEDDQLATFGDTSGGGADAGDGQTVVYSPELGWALQPVSARKLASQSVP